MACAEGAEKYFSHDSKMFPKPRFSGALELRGEGGRGSKEEGPPPLPESPWGGSTPPLVVPRLQAPKNSFVLNKLAPKRQRKFSIRQRPGRKLAQSFKGVGEGWVGEPPLPRMVLS